MTINHSQSKKKDAPEVTILCTTFNQKDYIRECLDSFVNQKTNFKYIAIVHDDCSTDGTKEIVEEYAKKYPDIIKPVFEKENQYSQGVDMYEKILYPMVKSKYIAYCEGDDYWIDENKLQMQYDEMESHPEASACVHNTKRILTGSHKETFYSKYRTKRKMTAEDIIYKWNIHTSSFFIRFGSHHLKEFAKKQIWCIDYPLMLGVLLDGDIRYLPEVMSVYRAHAKGGVSFTMDWKKLENRSFQMIELLDKFNEYSDYKYNSVVDVTKGSMLLNAAKAKYRKPKLTRKEFRNIERGLYSNSNFNNYRAQLSISQQIKVFLQTRVFLANKAMYFVYKQRNSK